jgi:hypothetical protein
LHAASAKPNKEAEEARIDMLDIRVGQIVSVQQHPNADALYLEEIDVGEEKPRQVCGFVLLGLSLSWSDGFVVQVMSCCWRCQQLYRVYGVLVVEEAAWVSKVSSGVLMCMLWCCCCGCGR